MRNLIITMVLAALGGVGCDERALCAPPADAALTAPRAASCVCACTGYYTVTAYCGPGETLTDATCGTTAGAVVTGEQATTGVLEGHMCAVTVDRGTPGAAAAVNIKCD
jgi:hypothetical protein